MCYNQRQPRVRVLGSHEEIVANAFCFDFFNHQDVFRAIELIINLVKTCNSIDLPSEELAYGMAVFMDGYYDQYASLDPAIGEQTYCDVIVLFNTILNNILRPLVDESTNLGYIQTSRYDGGHQMMIAVF